MTRGCLWTRSGARLQLRVSRPGSAYNWVFLPGGPGLGSESLLPLTALLRLPGRLWHLDLPNDGSNVIDGPDEPFSRWPQALVEAVSALDAVILVAHSTGGMYALATPELEPFLAGLVLMDSAPDASWQQDFRRHSERHAVHGIQELQERYSAHPDARTLREMSMASAACLSVPGGFVKDQYAFLNDLPYNANSHGWSGQHFDSTYEARWCPQHIPVLILGGRQDYVTPLRLFEQASRFQRRNVTLRAIDDAGHFPWVENPTAVAAAFDDYFRELP